MKPEEQFEAIEKILDNACSEVSEMLGIRGYAKESELVIALTFLYQELIDRHFGLQEEDPVKPEYFDIRIRECFSTIERMY